MSQPNKRRLKLTEMREQAAEAIGMEPGIEIELEDGSTVTVPSPIFLSDEAQSAMEHADEAGVVETAKIVLGEEQHARLIAGGGNSNDVMLAFRLLADDVQLDPKAKKR